jgi:predicted transcriptional regulator
MIANSLGNIFQKKVVKDPIYQALLDRHPDMDMQTISENLQRTSAPARNQSRSFRVRLDAKG